MYRRLLTINSGYIDEQLDNYPVMVKLTSENFDFTKVRSDGLDIKFTDIAEQLLDFEVEYFNSVENLAVFHIRIPTVSPDTDTQFYMRYGDGVEFDYSNKTGVWDDNFIMVQHMGDSLIDSTGNGNDGTNYGSTVVDGLNGKARSFDGVNDRVVIANIPHMSEMSLQTIVYKEYKSSESGIFGCWNTSDDNMHLETSSTGFRWRLGDLNKSDYTQISNNVFTHVVASYDGNTCKVTQNGITETGPSGSDGATLNDTFYIGESNGDVRWWKGTIDEVRISNIARSDAWIKADDYNLRTNTLIGISTEESTKPIIGIEIIQPPDKTLYYIDQELDLTGIVVMGTFSDDSVEEVAVSSSMITGFDSSVSQIGQVLTLEVRGVTATFTVDIEVPEIVSLKITQPPYKTTYRDGELFDITGLTAEGLYEDEIIRPVVLTEEHLTGFSTSEKGLKIITANYEGAINTFGIYVETEPVPDGKGSGQQIAIKFDRPLFSDVTGLIPAPCGRGDYFKPTGTATASNQYSSSYSPSRAFDGNTSNYWRPSSYPAWVQIELPEETWVYGFRWYVDSNRPENFEFEGSNDGEIWTALITSISEDVAGWQEFHTAQSAKYKFYRWKINSKYSSYVYIYEIELIYAVGNEANFTISGKEEYHINGDTFNKEYKLLSVDRPPIVKFHSFNLGNGSVNGTEQIGDTVALVGEVGSGELNTLLSLNKPVTGSNTLNAQNTSSGITNGDYNTANYVSAGGNPAWVMVDLEQVYAVNRLKIWHYFSDSRIYYDTKTEVSVDGVNWTTIYDSAVGGTYNESSGGKEHIFDAIPVRYIRDWTNGSNKNTGNHWVEIEAFGGDLEYNPSGEYISEPVDISTLPETKLSARGVFYLPDYTDVKLYYSISDDGITLGTFTELNDAGELPDLSTSKDKFLIIKAVLNTEDINVSPIIFSLNVEEYETQQDLLLLTLHPLNRFNKNIGNLLVSYDGNMGNLQGKGGRIESFAYIFTPVDLIPVPNPIVNETITVGLNTDVSLTPIYYTYTDNEETVSVSVSTIIDLIDVSVVNP